MTDTAAAPVLLSHDQAGVRTLTLNRPQRLNALNAELLQALQRALETAASDSGVKVVVLAGAGRGFSSGQDLQEALSVGGAPNAPEHLDFQGRLEQLYNPVICAIRDLPKPVLAAVGGVAAGAGASLALACDIRLASSEAQWVQSFSNLALVPDAGGTWTLPRTVGWARAFELMALAEQVDAQQALELGLCQRIYPAADFAAQVQAYAEAMAARPAGALALTKQALNAAATQTLGQSLQLEAQLQQRAGQGPEFAAGLRAFLSQGQ